MTEKIKIVAAIVNTEVLTMYTPDGKNITIPQGDPRVRRILETVPDDLIRDGFAMVDVSSGTENPYASFEKESNGAVKFFRIAKTKISNFFSKTKEATIVGTFGNIPDKTVETKAMVAEILQHAIPASSPSFNEDGIDKQRNIVESNNCTPSDKDDKLNASDTIVAVVGDKVVPGVERIKSQFSVAVKDQNTKGVEAFMKRIGAVINDRSHSVEDLLKFMERADMPIADDGSIIIYKVLRKKNGKYVDCHTGKVEQSIGSYVCMDKSLVDPNRRNECSNGLHVARRGYISQFSGDVCVVCKLNPEDVIAVPSYDANKMRVCGYHIIAELTSEQYQLLRNNQPITETEDGKLLLANLIAGNHDQPTNIVKIGGHNGTSVTTTPVEKRKEIPALLKPVVPKEALSNADVEVRDNPIDPKKVAKKVIAITKAAAKKPAKKKAKAKKPVTVNSEGSYRERIQKLLAIGLSPEVAKSILSLKKASKKGWQALGITDEQGAEIARVAAS